MNWRLGVVGLLVISVSACAPPRRAQVIERNVITERVETERIGGPLVRHVQHGDTLYSIAFAHDLNPNDIAAWNNISNINHLLIGQRLRLTKPIGFVRKSTPVKPKKNVQTPTTPRTTPRTTKNYATSPYPLPRLPLPRLLLRPIIRLCGIGQCKGE